MRTLLYAIAATVNGLITLEKILVARKVWRSDRRVLYSLGFMIAFTASIVLQIDPVRALIDGLTNTAGLPWLLSSISLMLSLSGSRWMYPLLLAALSVLVLAFLMDVVVLGDVQKWAIDSFPHSTLSCVSMGAPNVYNAIMGTVAFVLFLRLRRGEDVYLTRIRWGIIAIVALSGTVHHLTRTALILIGYIQPASQVLNVLDPVATTAKGIAGLLWPLGTLSNKTYRAMGMPSLNKRKALAAVKAFHERLDRSLGLAQMPMVAAAEAVNSGRSGLSDLYLYQTAIAIVDRKKTLSNRPIERQDEEATSICEALAAIDESTEFHEIISLCKAFDSQKED
jgi:hypothetical protein